MVGDFGGRTTIDPPDNGCAEVSFASGATLYGAESTLFAVYEGGFVAYKRCGGATFPHVAPLSTLFTWAEILDGGEVTHEEHNGNLMITYDSVPLSYEKRDEDPVSSQVIITPVLEMVVIHHFESDPEPAGNGAVYIGVAAIGDDLMDRVYTGEQCKGTFCSSTCTGSGMAVHITHSFHSVYRYRYSPGLH